MTLRGAASFRRRMRRAALANRDAQRAQTPPLEEQLDELEEDGPMDLEDQLDQALDRAFPRRTS
jgi:hypothetical protein